MIPESIAGAQSALEAAFEADPAARQAAAARWRGDGRQAEALEAPYGRRGKVVERRCARRRFAPPRCRPYPTLPGRDCAQGSVETGPCEPVLDACMSDFACTKLLECHTDCEWTSWCNQQCDAIIPSGLPLFTALMDCVVCGACPVPCAGSSLSSYCP